MQFYFLRSSEVLKFGSFCRLNLNSNIFIVLVTVIKLLINLIMSCCLKLWCSPKRNGANVLSKTLFSECYFLLKKWKEGLDLRKEQFVIKSMCKAFCSQKLRCRKDLKLLLRFKRNTCDCESVISFFKVNASLITLIQACECKEEGTVLRFSNLQTHVVSKLRK